MIIPERPSLERRVLTVLEGSAGIPARIPVVLGGCGAGRTSLLLRLRDLIGRTSCQYIDVERVATTPERFFSSIRGRRRWGMRAATAMWRRQAKRRAGDCRRRARGLS